MKQEESPSDKTATTFKSVEWRSLSSLSRRVGHRYGFASVSLSSTEVALLGGVVHFELSQSQSAKGDIERGNPIPFSQLHCIGAASVVTGPESFGTSLLSIRPASDLPCPRLYHSASRFVFPSHTNGTRSATARGCASVVVFGGQAFSGDKRKLADIWCLDLEEDTTPGMDDATDGVPKYMGQWHELAPSPLSRAAAFPPPRSMHAVSSSGNHLIVSGGCGFDDTVLGDLWSAQIELAPETAAVAADQPPKKVVQWRRISSQAGRSPQPRKSHALTPMVSDIELLLYGGLDGDGNSLNDLWIIQFTNEEKSRCVWTELVRSPLGRYGHIMFPAAGPKRDLLVFGGNTGNAGKYNLDSGEWSECPCEDLKGLTFTAAQIDTTLPVDDKVAVGGTTPAVVTIPSVLMIPDSVVRTSPGNPWLANVFACDPVPDAPATGDEKDKAEAAAAVKEDPCVRIAREDEYRRLASQLPQLPAPTGLTSGNGAVCVAGAVTGGPVVSAPAQSGFFVVSHLSNRLWDSDTQISLSSWRSASATSCHVLVTGEGTVSRVDSLESMRGFVNSAATAAAVAGVANSCVIVATAPSGERFLAFVSESLTRHASCSRDANRWESPVVSISNSEYAAVQATLRLIAKYTPFSSPEAVEELFSLFANCSAGFVLVDFDGKADSPVPAIGPVQVVKDSAAFWLDALKSWQLHRIDQYAITALNGCTVAVNGKLPSVGLYASLKSKLLKGAMEQAIAPFGNMLVGTLASDNVGVLLYSHGQFIRHLDGRSVLPEGYNVTGVVDVEDFFTPVAGAHSDFAEAVSNTAEWTQFLAKIEEVCTAFSKKQRSSKN